MAIPRAPALLLLAALVCGCEPAPPRERLDADTLHSEARELAGLAAEAALFADELAAGHLSAAYAWVHQQSLASEAQRIASDLTQPAPPALQPGQAHAVAVAGALALQVTQVATARRQPQRLRELREAMEGLHAQARALQEAP